VSSEKTGGMFGHVPGGAGVLKQHSSQFRLEPGEGARARDQLCSAGRIFQADPEEREVRKERQERLNKKIEDVGKEKSRLKRGNYVL